jgi:hypothetical protein
MLRRWGMACVLGAAGGVWAQGRRRAPIRRPHAPAGAVLCLCPCAFSLPPAQPAPHHPLCRTVCPAHFGPPPHTLPHACTPVQPHAAAHSLAHTRPPGWPAVQVLRIRAHKDAVLGVWFIGGPTGERWEARGRRAAGLLADCAVQRGAVRARCSGWTGSRHGEAPPLPSQADARARTTHASLARLHAGDGGGAPVWFWASGMQVLPVHGPQRLVLSACLLAGTPAPARPNYRLRGPSSCSLARLSPDMPIPTPSRPGALATPSLRMQVLATVGADRSLALWDALTGSKVGACLGWGGVRCLFQTEVVRHCIQVPSSFHSSCAMHVDRRLVH